jgi:hypothetical protein
MNHAGDKAKPAADNRDTTNAKKNGARNTAPLFETPRTVLTKEAENPKWSDEERTYYRRYLRTQKTIVLITLGGVALALFTLRALNKSVSAANRQADAAATQARTAQKEFELSERPWISADPIQFSDLTFDKSGYGHFTIRFLFKNTGHSPAPGTHIEAQLIPIKFDRIFKEPLERQKKLCGDARTPKTASEFAAFTLFPGDQTTREAGMSMSPGDIKNAEYPSTKGRSFIVPIIVGCVDYQFEFASGHHQTGFIYQLWRLNPADHFVHGNAIYPGDNLPVSRMRFEPYAFGGSYAD